ncbi:patatin-like phospholipase family protein [Promicromonospora sukumoe]|uniref:patatin-like phospholipase family protein n=1 Tax=Promicromonospora sukumoe TaxID=88382 RepID=UPI0003A47ECB|nr:patatin-like phospholipase family protein [Promicromonospora sukumoe]
MNTTPSSAVPRTRALVLGGGGTTGNAWLIGVVAGLYDAGVDVTAADLTLGTSAGSTTAAQLGGATPAELYAAVLAAPAPAPAGARPTQDPARVRAAAEQMERTRRIVEGATDVADMRRRLGAAALDLPGTSDDTVQAQWRATVAARLPGQDWPDRAIVLTAVDARTGEPVLFDRHSGVDLADAVAASCSSGFAYRIGERRYIDGGYRANAENADLAAGYARVLVLSPFGGRTRAPADWGLDLATQVSALRAGGSRVETVFPGDAAELMSGAGAMDYSRRPAVAQAGYEQGKSLAGPVGELWR